ncbi:MAG TPA: hypothetical protein VFX30_14735 [bacterium]|nr:hypothetical protein [bacterium]
MSHVLSWLHVTGVAVSLGTGLFLVFVFFPALKIIEDRQQRMKLLAAAIQYFHPIFLLGICTVFMTGAIRLTDLKIDFGQLYYSSLGHVLLWKFGLTTLIFLIAGGQCFGMGLKLQRMANGVIEGTIERQERLANAIKKMATYNLIALAVTIYFGLKLLPIVYGQH